jgi:hypothetical protein
MVTLVLERDWPLLQRRLDVDSKRYQRLLSV